MTTTDSMWRLFIAIDLPEEVKRLLSELQAELGHHTTAIRWADPAGTHLTLKFLGNTPSRQVDAIHLAMQEAVLRLEPFELRTDELGAFPNARRPRVVWLGLGDATGVLARLQAQVEQLVAPLGFPPEQRPFHPHLTLGRSYKDAAPAQVASIGHAVARTKVPRSIVFAVNEVVLMRSELHPGGSRYSRLRAARLDGSP